MRLPVLRIIFLTPGNVFSPPALSVVGNLWSRNAGQNVVQCAGVVAKWRKRSDVSRLADKIWTQSMNENIKRKSWYKTTIIFLCVIDYLKTRDENIISSIKYSTRSPANNLSSGPKGLMDCITSIKWNNAIILKRHTNLKTQRGF